LTRANSLRLLRQLISTCELVFTLCVSTDRGPVANSCSSVFSACGSDRCDETRRCGEEGSGQRHHEDGAVQRGTKNETLAAGMTVRNARGGSFRGEAREL
jgi:hypothetical protein